jgi:hypothetical protein
MRLAIFVTLALWTATSCRAQTVAMSVAQLDCGQSSQAGVPPPTSKEEYEQISASWAGPSELKVGSWSTQTVDSRIDPETAKLRIEGNTIFLSYSFRAIEQPANAPHLVCAFFTRLTFTISTLPRKSYQVRVENEHSKPVSVQAGG